MFPTTTTEARDVQQGTSRYGIGIMLLIIFGAMVYAKRRRATSSSPALTAMPSFSSKTKEESPAPPSSPKSFAPQRRRSRAGSDLAGFQLLSHHPAPPPSPQEEAENAVAETTRTQRYLSLLYAGLASPFVSRKSIRNNNVVEEEEEEDSALPAPPPLVRPSKLNFAFTGNEFDETIDLV